MKSQKQVWNNIAQEWHEFKETTNRETEEFLKDKKGKILDLGSGSGRHLSPIKGKMYLVDFSDNMIKLAKKRAKEKEIDAEFFVADATKLPFDKDYFDYAIFIAVLHCIPTKEKRKRAIQELYRVMKPKSQSIIVVWNKNSKRFKNSQKEKLIKWRDKGERYYYLYEEEEIHRMFKDIGFKIKKRFKPERNIVFIVEKD